MYLDPFAPPRGLQERLHGHGGGVAVGLGGEPSSIAFDPDDTHAGEIRKSDRDPVARVLHGQTEGVEATDDVADGGRGEGRDLPISFHRRASRVRV